MNKDNALSYPVDYNKEDDGRYTVTFPDFPDAITQGDTLVDAVYMAQDCLSFTVWSRINEGESLPIPATLQSMDAFKYVTLVIGIRT